MCGAGVVSTLTGGSKGFVDGREAKFAEPRGLCFDVEGDRLLCADSINHRIRAVRPDGRLSAVADVVILL